MATQTIDSTLVANPVRTASATFTVRVAALFLMMTGWGWNAGNFVQPANTSWGATADLLHVVPLAILLPLSLVFIGRAMAGTDARGIRYGISGLAVFAIVSCSVMIVLGLTNPDPNSVGVHTFEDWMPVIVLNAGTLLWLGTQVTARALTRRLM